MRFLVLLPFLQAVCLGCGVKDYGHVSKKSDVSDRSKPGDDESAVQAVNGTHPNQSENRENRSTSCDCGRRYIPEILLKLQNSSSLGRIYQGDDARIGEFTWMVSIRNSDMFVRCGGSLITPHHILTAAHCAANVVIGEPHSIKDSFVTVGKINRDFTPEETLKIIYIEKNDVYVHERFLETRDKNHDIAVLFMREPVQYGPKVGPACLPKTYPDDLMYSEVITSGWGLNEEQWLPNKLKFTRLYTIPTEVCDLTHRDMICIFKNGTGTCRGDSGGPVMHYDQETKRYFQISVISHGFTVECLPGFTATTNLTQHYEWIENIVRETMPSVHICTKI